jgi:hypothetical protein
MARTRTTFDSARGKAATKGTPPKARPLHAEDIRALRGQEIVTRRVAGMSPGEIGAELGLSGDHVGKELKWMRDTGRIRQYESNVLGLVPAAVAAVQKALAAGNAQIGVKVLDMLLKLGERAEARSDKQSDQQASLQTYLQKQLIRDALRASKAEGAEGALIIAATPVAEPLAGVVGDSEPDSEPDIEPDIEPQTLCP